MQTIMVIGSSSGQEHRHTLVSGVRLRAHVAEHEQSVGCREQRIGWTIIAIQLEVARAGCLAYYEHIHLSRVLGMLRHCIEAEIGYIIIVMCRKRTLMHRQTQIIEHIDGIQIVLNVIFKLALLLVAFGISYVAAYEQQCQRQYQTQRTAYGKALKFAVDAHTLSPLPCRYCEQRQIEYEHACHGWHQIVEQFHCLTGIGGDEIEKHVDGYHTVAVQVDKHHLKRCEEDKQEQHPHHTPDAAVERHDESINQYR